ncbi:MULTISPECIES: hypothetical protein [unclassified Microbacterium]|uniref:hypothetical protein n=1 Tax=unclassified Microbacterium TaxID=2609290 RepID=UPI000417908F|nr:hypothetical protein [Microbacterium sp. B24]
MTARKTSTAAADAIAAEAVAEPITFPFQGETYSILPTSEWTYSTIVAFEQGRLSTFLSAVLDKDSLARFAGHDFKIALVGEFVDAASTAAGIQGN